MLTVADFPSFFREVYDTDPFPWQYRLLQQVAGTAEWPSVLDLPTGSGKMAAIDIAVFHLALEAENQPRRARVRIGFIVDRRLVVDDAYARAAYLACALAQPPGQISACVADRLKVLAGDGPPLIARRLRGGLPHEDDWARTPAQPTVLCSTVDQLGSRLLFRGYGITDSMKPVHAGLLGADCQILLDEAHLAEPFRQTLEWVGRYQGPSWNEMGQASWGFALLTATPDKPPENPFTLLPEDYEHPRLGPRLRSSKPIQLVAIKTTRSGSGGPEDAAARDLDQDGSEPRTKAIVDTVRAALQHFQDPTCELSAPAIGVVVNCVTRARAVFQLLERSFNAEINSGAIRSPILLIGPARPVDRDKLAKELAPIRTGCPRDVDRPMIVVGTQCIEAGVDIDLDALITEIAPLDALRQRFGRLNRGGRPVTPFGAILGFADDLSRKADDPVYGGALVAAWERLQSVAKGSNKIVDFGLTAFAVSIDKTVLSPRANAPILLPAHLDLLSQTSPVPSADPEVALYLRGENREPDAINVVWRGDIDPRYHGRDEDVRRLLLLVPPKAAEAIELPLWAVRHWLRQDRREQDRLADVPVITPEESEDEGVFPVRRIFRWRGDTDDLKWIGYSMIRPGDTIVVPASYGGVDRFGWNPDFEEPAEDVGREAALPLRDRRFAVRIAPGLISEEAESALAEALSQDPSGSWSSIRSALLDLPLSEPLRADLMALQRGVTRYLDLYGTEDERPRGIVIVAPRGVRDVAHKQMLNQLSANQPSTTEDDTAGSIPGFRQTLTEHLLEVERKAGDFAIRAGLPQHRVADLVFAARLHDLGKIDARFQSWMHYGDPLGPDLRDSEAILAKSGRYLGPNSRADSGLPEHWRHESLSVRLAEHALCFREAHDPQLVLWLVGSHHGYGRPFFPHCDPEDAKPRELPLIPPLKLPAVLPAGAGPQSLSWDRKGVDWASLFVRLKARYGVWELARLEAILRLADHRASEDAERLAPQGEAL